MCLERDGAFSAIAIEQKLDVVKGLDKLYEFEREPLMGDKLQPARYLPASFVREHIAGTEFTIGALWVALGLKVAGDFLFRISFSHLFLLFLPVYILGVPFRFWHAPACPGREAL